MTNNRAGNERIGWGTFRYLVATVIVLWQCMAILIGPAPASYSKDKIDQIFSGYLDLFHLNNHWAFFASDPARGTVVRYRIKDGQGRLSQFPLTESLRRTDPTYSRYTSLLDYISDNESIYINSYAQYLCKQHRELEPQWLIFVLREQRRFHASDYRKGLRPLDKKFIRERQLPRIRCTPNGKQP
jgi:hypothetical protein